jgi:hypothetical protein
MVEFDESAVNYLTNRSTYDDLTLVKATVLVGIHRIDSPFQSCLGDLRYVGVSREKLRSGRSGAWLEAGREVVVVLGGFVDGRPAHWRTAPGVTEGPTATLSLASTALTLSCRF